MESKKRTTKTMKSVSSCWLLVTGCCLLAASSWSLAAPIDPTHKHAWSENAGWIDHRTTHGAVTIYADHLEGHAWGEWARLPLALLLTLVGFHTLGRRHDFGP